MGLFKWFERKLWTGDVLEDYGDLQDERISVGRIRTRVLLCRRKGKMKLVFRTTGTTPLSANVYYSMIDVTPASLARLGEIVMDAKQKLETNVPPMIPS